MTGMKHILILSSGIVFLHTGMPALASSADAPRATAWHADRNGDGRVSAAEKKHARYLYNRIDVDDDGRIGPRERRYAHQLNRRLDRNHDGRIGPRERKTAYRVMNRIDRKF